MPAEDWFRSASARQRYDAVVAALPDTIVGLDFDGTLSPIVEDPAAAHIHPEAARALVALAGQVRAVAVITGRPARQAIALGGLDEIGREIADLGKELFVFGQYGNEPWSSNQRRVVSPRPPHGLASFQRELPAVLRRHEAQDAYVEDKGLAVAVHTRRLADPDAVLTRLTDPIATLAAAHDLAVEPGRQVLEIRSGGMHKGMVVHDLAERLDARGFVFAGDDLGDLEAFAAVRELEDDGLATLLVCSASGEESALAERADLVVPGPDGVVELLTDLARPAR